MEIVLLSLYNHPHSTSLHVSYPDFVHQCLFSFYFFADFFIVGHVAAFFGFAFFAISFNALSNRSKTDFLSSFLTDLILATLSFSSTSNARAMKRLS
jgi:hypothetical protein